METQDSTYRLYKDILLFGSAIFLLLIVLSSSNSLLPVSINKSDYDYCMKVFTRTEYFPDDDGLYWTSGIPLDKYVPTSAEKEKIRGENLDIYINENGEIYYRYYGRPDDYLVAIENNTIIAIVGRKYFFIGKTEFVKLRALLQTKMCDYISTDPRIIFDEASVSDIFDSEKYRNDRWWKNALQDIFR
ncbi:MAG: hypothetical protein FWG35_06920 [Spirochaetaceae bacterium]|nr:hypothetical protein [Spirochaetaceae bacterium]